MTRVRHNSSYRPPMSICRNHDIFSQNKRRPQIRFYISYMVE